MDRALNRLVEIRDVLREHHVNRRGPRQEYTDATIVLMYYLAVVNNQTQKWACDPGHWPFKMPPGGLPSASQFSRRLRSAAAEALLGMVARRVNDRDPPPTDRVVTLRLDARPLVIGPHSHDQHAGYGRAAGGKARGYKLHAIIDACGRAVAWRIAPMNVDERVMARRMIQGLNLTGYLLADKNYDSNELFGLARVNAMQMVVPRRFGADKSMGRRKQDAARLRSRDMLETPGNDFARELYHTRVDIERTFGLHATTPELLTHLPAWIRGYSRVHRWVQAKLTLAELHRQDLKAKRNPAA